ncbi:TIR domain-containing protein [Geoalkalibacter halelectricus]|uniref:TIR domain-containing protein n=1 Tax=Geoalkalibacter halelectricus TaxID=2847045 RepID=UPI00345FB92C
MSTLHRYKLFISHAWRYSERYDRMINFLNAAPRFIYANHSIPEDRAFGRMSVTELKEQLREQIRPVEVVIIIGGMYVAHSDCQGSALLSRPGVTVIEQFDLRCARFGWLPVPVNSGASSCGRTLLS